MKSYINVFIGYLLMCVCTSCLADIEKDKQLHLGVSVIIGSGLQYINEDQPFNNFLGCGFIGLGKELYDEVDYGGFEERDLVYDLLGCGLGVSGIKYYQDRDVYWITYKIDF